MASCVYVLCALTSFLCMILLLRDYRKKNIKLLLWCVLCFGGFALNNALVFIDLVILQNGPDLTIVRTVPALAGVAALLGGLIWESV